MKKLIAVSGESASGKNILVDLLVSQHSKMFHRKISRTTREPRLGEIDGEDYHFVTREEFFELVMAEKMIEAAEVGEEMYGTLYDDLREDKINVGIFDPQGLEILAGIKDIHLLPIYVKTDERIRMKRALDRETSIDDIYKRYVADRKLFYGIEDFPNMLILNNQEGQIDFNVRIVKLIADGIFSE